MINKTISKYMATIGAKGGASGKGSPARKAAAIAANKARWDKHRAQKKANDEPTSTSPR